MRQILKIGISILPLLAAKNYKFSDGYQMVFKKSANAEKIQFMNETWTALQSSNDALETVLDWIDGLEIPDRKSCSEQFSEEVESATKAATDISPEIILDSNFEAAFRYLEKAKHDKIKTGIEKCIKHLKPANETSLLSQLLLAMNKLKFADTTVDIDWSELSIELNDFGVELSAEEAQSFFTAKRFSHMKKMKNKFFGSQQLKEKLKDGNSTFWAKIDQKFGDKFDQTLWDWEFLEDIKFEGLMAEFLNKKEKKDFDEFMENAKEIYTDILNRNQDCNSTETDLVPTERKKGGGSKPSGGSSKPSKPSSNKPSKPSTSSNKPSKKPSRPAWATQSKPCLYCGFSKKPLKHRKPNKHKNKWADECVDSDTMVEADMEIQQVLMDIDEELKVSERAFINVNDPGSSAFGMKMTGFIVLLALVLM